MIFGSTATHYHFPDFRSPKDLDCMDNTGVVTRKEQHYWVPTFEKIIKLSKNKEYLDPELILTIKASHANWDIHWDKTMADILFLKSKGLKINKSIYNSLIKDWTRVHGKMSAPLRGKTATTFFNDAVHRKYVHDDIHEAVAYYDQPLFYSILEGDGTVLCSEKKFNNLSHEDKVKLAKEEIFVTALERWIIPNNFNYSKGRAYNAALKKFVTTMSSGFMSYFLIDNFQDLICNTDDYVLRFTTNEHYCRTL
jgi:hypothetical protein